MSEFEVVVIKKQDSSTKEFLSQILNPNVNKISCTSYGNGNHCNSASVERKFDIWGKRGDEVSDADECALARIIKINGEAAAFMNIGYTGGVHGEKPTIVIHTAVPHYVYELSGLMVADKYLNLDNNSNVVGIDSRIIEAAKGVLKSCNANSVLSQVAGVDTERVAIPNNKIYTKVVSTFSTSHPYQKEFSLSVGAKELTEKNLSDVMGVNTNSFNPDRFKFEGEKFYECSKWNQDEKPVTHEGFYHATHPCTEWTPKEICVFDIVGRHIEVNSEL